MKIIPKGTIIVIHCSTGYCGMDSEEYFRLSHDYFEKELDDIAWQMGLDNADMYGIYLEMDEEEDEDNPYSGDNIDGYWEIASEEDAVDINDKYL